MGIQLETKDGQMMGVESEPAPGNGGGFLGSLFATDKHAEVELEAG